MRSLLRRQHLYIILYYIMLLISFIEKITEEANQDRKLRRDKLKALVNEEKRRNDLFEKFFDTLKNVGK